MKKFFSFIQVHWFIVSLAVIAIGYFTHQFEGTELWEAAAFFLFVAAGYKKILEAIGGALDQRAVKIKAELDEANRLREEAAALLKQYQQKQAEYLKEAEALLKDARRDADILRAHAEQELKNSLATRTKQAMERIGQEEANAIADVRNHIVDISMASARALIADHIATMSQDDLIRLALSDIEHKIH